MKIEEKKLRRFIRNEIKKTMNEANYSERDIGQAFNYTLEELEIAIESIRNPETFVERYPRTGNTIIEKMNELISMFDRMN